MRKHKQRFSIRKYSFGAASVLLGAAVLATLAPEAHADDVNTPVETGQETAISQESKQEAPATNSEASAGEETSQTKVVSVTKEGDTVTTTSEVTSSSLEEAKATASQAGVTVEEEPAKVQPSVQAAQADNKAQAESINQTVADYQSVQEQYAAQKASYEEAKAARDAKLAEKAAADKANAEAKAKYEKELAIYNQAKAAYDKALEVYTAEKSKYNKDLVTYEIDKAKKEAADKANAEAKAKYEKELVAYNQALAQYDKDLADYQAKKAVYDLAKKTYDDKTAEKEAADKENAANEAKYQAELAAYNAAYKKYQADKAAYETKKKIFDDKTAEKAAADKVNAEVKARYEIDKAEYEAAMTKYDQDIVTYQKKLAEYETAKEQYKNNKEAYEKYKRDNKLTDAEIAQDLTFKREKDATHTIEGINTYLTPEAQQRIGQNAVKQYDSNQIKDGDVVAQSPYSNKESEWLEIKVGDKFSVTYDGLNQSSMKLDDKIQYPIKRVIYRYEILELPSSNGKGIAKVDADPTVTLTVGASSDDPSKSVKVAVDAEFYNDKGEMYDLSKRTALIALNSLNHWSGAAYIDEGDKPRALTVEAKDINGNTVRGVWDPYPADQKMQMDHGEVKTVSGRANFTDKDGNPVEVKYSSKNPIRIVIQIYDWDSSSQQWVEEFNIDVYHTTANASGAGNGHSIGTPDDLFQFQGKDDVLGTYTIDPASGLISFTPKRKFQTVEHKESVNIGNKEYIQIPNSSVSYDPQTKEVTSVNDNQYIEHGAVFNGETTSTMEGWDNPDSRYLYYGGAAVKLTDGHMEFTAKGANAEGAPVVYWFAINSNVGFPQEPGEEPKEPTPPTPPTKPTPPTPIRVDVPKKPGEEPKEPTPPTPPTPIRVDVPKKPGEEPKEPTPPTKPTGPKTTTIEVPKKPNEPKKPEAPTPPEKPVLNTVEVPVEPVEPPKPEMAKVVWHKNLVVEKHKEPRPALPPTPPRTPSKPAVPTPMRTPSKPAVPTPVADRQLPITGDQSSYGMDAFGAGMVAFALATMLAAKKRRED